MSSRPPAEERRTFVRDWFKRHGNQCPDCRCNMTMDRRRDERMQQLPNMATVHHIVPISIPQDRPNRKENLMVLCRLCNEKRGNTVEVEILHLHAPSVTPRVLLTRATELDLMGHATPAAVLRALATELEMLLIRKAAKREELA